ncbi:hypothetical protein [Methylobacterium sp. J-076]|uniref:hypothetical protein n=1 Tax=Methylobacterium sp. J-076 TaxID=2836655 RepID=UPI001FBAF7E0|nr:hypothetical protein [Methylobacterium sp. J-076]MCJ2015443.1 hypothetical protein [Methylobacterium sp. J-076]
MPWYAVRPRDPADPRWPLPGKERIVLKADNSDDARARFEEAYPSEPFGSPTVPVRGSGLGSFHGKAVALIVEETDEPPSPKE